MVLVISRSDETSCWLYCERNGRRRIRKSYDLPSKVMKSRKAASRKCGCLFRIKCREVFQKHWEIEVTHGTHNHPLVTYMEGNRFYGRLTCEEYNVAKESIVANVKTNKILGHIREKFLRNLSVVKTITNARQKVKREGREGRSIVQQFLFKADEYKYFHRHRKFEGGVASELFFAHPQSVNLLRSFPYVLIMDATYKTNWHKMPLFEIVGFTSTGKTFPVACVLMSEEKQVAYDWVLRILKEMLQHVGKMPNEFVTDRELALLNAMKLIFPSVPTILWEKNRHVSVDGLEEVYHGLFESWTFWAEMMKAEKAG